MGMTSLVVVRNITRRDKHDLMLLRSFENAFEALADVVSHGLTVPKVRPNSNSAIRKKGSS